MKYFVLYTGDASNDHVHECYLKGQSTDYVEKCIDKYSNGFLSTNKWTLITSNIDYGFLREIDQKELPLLTNKNFAEIDESSCF
ncbi:hypothetical protein [Fictibacillus phosphorivorans]|uniref:hypothetical protein n=1 Tax=Fictibacillus phosphorivorans TaxID=1221500 RepID=UPI0020420974|nr:hypothetical protein [Fictibacillus phosphorivorans]MCM3719435.1 hypothetical protein [Fictibacillus phosphorivorans]MCM3777087.1 hypothetical protein [Fictibacillus phosphorivorans]